MEPYFSLNRALIELQQRLNSALNLSSDKERAHPPFGSAEDTALSREPIYYTPRVEPTCSSD
jgi:hypothetical protein